MGSGEEDQLATEEEKPARIVEISQPFWMAAQEVTVAQFRIFADETEYVTVAEREGGRVWDSKNASMRRDSTLNWRSPGYDRPQEDEEPVVQIAREDAEQFCAWLSSREGRLYRLPTEAEWEYACRAGTRTRWSMGDDPSRLGDVAWTRENSDRHLHPVRQKEPNPWGLFDMHGNARELCCGLVRPLSQAG